MRCSHALELLLAFLTPPIYHSPRIDPAAPLAFCLRHLIAGASSDISEDARWSIRQASSPALLHVRHPVKAPQETRLPYQSRSRAVTFALPTWDREPGHLRDCHSFKGSHACRASGRHGLLEDNLCTDHNRKEEGFTTRQADDFLSDFLSNPHFPLLSLDSREISETMMVQNKYYSHYHGNGTP